MCEPCRPDCASCEGSSNRCTRCAPRLLLHDGQCWPTCPERTFQFNQRSVDSRPASWGRRTAGATLTPARRRAAAVDVINFRQVE